MSSTTLLYTTAARARRKAVFSAISEEVATDFLAMAERRIEKRCDYVFNSASRTEYHSGRNKPYFFVRAYPITAITSLVVIDENGDEDTIDVSGSDSDIVWDAGNGKISFGPDNTSIYNVFPKTYPENVKLVYTAGYESDSVPDDLQEAVIVQAMILYAMTSLNMNAGLASQKIGAGSKQRVGQAIIDGWETTLNMLLEGYMRTEM